MWSPMSSVGSMEPEGILNAWTTNVLINNARTTAITIASIFSRLKVPLKQSACQ